MKLKERGIGTGALVGIVVVIVAVAIVVPVSLIVLMGGSGGSGATILAGLPKYPGAQEATMSAQETAQITGSLPSGWSVKAYTTGQAGPENVIGWYRTQMAGWTNTADNTLQYTDPTTSYTYTFYLLQYVKGNDAVSILTSNDPTQYGNFLVLAAGPKQGSGGTTGGGTTGGGSIVGTWQGSHLGSTETFTFSGGGTYTYSCGGTPQNGTWSMSGDVLTLDGSSTQFKVVFGTNSMQWYEKDPYTNDWMTEASRSFTKA